MKVRIHYNHTMSIRTGHEWYKGVPGSYNTAQLKKLAGRWICCPGCTIDAYTEGNCHTGKIVDEFKAKFPDLEAPLFVSGNTKCVEGKGGLRDVLVTRDAIFCGCKPPRGAPTSRELGVSLPASIFGNPEVMARINEKRLKTKEDKEEKKRAAKHGQSASESHRRDLPVMSIAEGEAERRACFEKAWAQKRAREEKEKKASSKKQA